MPFLLFLRKYLRLSSIYIMNQDNEDKNDDNFQNSLTQCYDKVLHKQHLSTGGLFYLHFTSEFCSLTSKLNIRDL